jgi:hypothetical protein
MKLTGKCKEDFREYLLNGIVDASYTYRYFITLPKSMQFGVYVDFFDSVGINIIARTYCYVIYEKSLGVKESNSLDEGFSKSRPDAREKAIEKANEIYNEK